MKDFTTEIPKVYAVLEKTTSIDYFDLFQDLSGHVETIKDDATKATEVELFVLLAKACTLIFSTENEEVPLVPYIVMPTYQSVSIDMFTDEELTLYSEIVHRIVDYRIQARLADILYLAPNYNVDNKQRAQYANMAVEAYSKFPINEQSWLRGGKDAIERLCSLGLKTQGKTSGFKEKITGRLLSACLCQENTDLFYSYELAHLLYKNKLGKKDYNTVVEHIHKCGDAFLANNRHFEAVKCYELSCALCERLNNEEKKAFFYKLVADAYEKGVPFLHPLFGQANLVKAKENLQRIPRRYKTDDILLRIGKLDSQIEEMRELAHEQTVECSFPVDITPYVLDAKKTVSGLDKYEALLGLLKISHICNKEEIISSSIERIKAHPLQYSCVRYRFHRNGQLLEKYDGGEYMTKELNEENPILKEAIVQVHDMLIGLNATGRILPALEVLHQEHRYSYADFLEICEASCIIPAGRSDLFAKGLYAGYNFDFVTAAYILAPQLENLVRRILKARGVRTTSVINDSDKESEVGLGTLVGKIEVEEYFGPNCSFAIASLFCDDRGANIRNEVAHGMVDSTIGNQAAFIYAWWFIFRLIASKQFFVRKCPKL